MFWSGQRVFQLRAVQPVVGDGGEAAQRAQEQEWWQMWWWGSRKVERRGGSLKWFSRRAGEGVNPAGWGCCAHKCSLGDTVVNLESACVCVFSSRSSYLAAIRVGRDIPGVLPWAAEKVGAGEWEEHARITQTKNQRILARKEDRKYTLKGPMDPGLGPVWLKNHWNQAPDRAAGLRIRWGWEQV